MVIPRYPLNQIYFYLTEGCNLACRHCWIAPKFQTGKRQYVSLDFDIFKSIIKQAKPLGLVAVKLTGGEPLLHPRIIDILEFVKTSGIRLVLETNGLLCTLELAKKIAECKTPSVSISIDSPDASTHEWVRRVKGSFKKAKEGFRNLTAAGLKPQIIMAVMRRNKGQLEGMIRLAESWGAGSVKFNIVQPTERGEEMRRRGETLSVPELVSLGRWVENSLARRTKLRLFYHHPQAFKALGKIFGDKADGCGTCGILGILGVLADGSYALCGIGESVPELVFGDAAKDRLKDIWNDTPVLQELREGMPNSLKGICADCIMKTRCLGSCVAQNYYRSKSLWAGFWYCEEADKAGLFPATRKKVLTVSQEKRCAIAILKDVLSRHSYNEKRMFAVGLNPYTLGAEYLPLWEHRVKDKTPLNILIALFTLGLKVDYKRATTVFSEKEIEELLGAGLLNDKLLKGQIISSFKITPYKRLRFLSDFMVRGSPIKDARKNREKDTLVYPPGYDSISLADTLVQGEFGLALDLCSGCGIQAILVSRNARRVIGVDINPRAIKLANMNLIFNDIANVEFRLGDLYGPVRAEEFDYVVTNPPFVISHKRTVAYRDGGKRGDAVFKRILEGLPQHLKDGGYCQIVAFMGEFSRSSQVRLFEQWSAANRFDSILLTLDEYGGVELTRGQFRNYLPDFKKYKKRAAEYMTHLERTGFKKVSYCLMAIKNNSNQNAFKRYDPNILRLIGPIDIINKHYKKC